LLLYKGLVFFNLVITRLVSFKGFLTALMTAGLLLLSSCSAEEEPILMPTAEHTRYVLDLSRSNDYWEQWERLKKRIYSDLQSEALGNPYGEKAVGPKALSITFIMASASQAKVIRISSSEFGSLLYDKMRSVHGRTSAQLVNDWPLLLTAYREALGGSFSNASTCVDSTWKLMQSQLAETLSKTIADEICVFTLRVLNTIEMIIPATLGPGGGSDVFGSLREIQSWVETLRESDLQTKVSVILASDMVHDTGGQRDLLGKDGLLTAKIEQKEVCDIANSQASISALQFSDVSFDVIGRGNSASVNADEAEALSIFWNCFAKASKFRINFSTDGSN